MTDNHTAPAPRPAFLGDAKPGDSITFRLPADLAGAFDTFTGTVDTIERGGHATGSPVIHFTLSGEHAGRPFACRPSLHIEISTAHN